MMWFSQRAWRHALVAVALVLPLIGVVGPANAPADGAAPAAREPLSCSDLVIGFDRQSRVNLRYVKNGRVLHAHSAERRFERFDVLSSGLAGWHDYRDHIGMNIATLNSDGRPRYFYVEERDSAEGEQRPLYVELKPLARRAPGQELYAEAASYYVYLIDVRGNLKRWTVYESGGGGGGAYYYADPLLVRSGLRGVRTLAWNGTMVVRGEQADLLWATTRSGALEQIQVPLDAPRQSRVVVVRRSGFADVTGLSAGICNGRASHASLITVARGNDRARWFTLRSQAEPRSSNLVRRKAVGPDLDWNLGAIS